MPNIKLVSALKNYTSIVNEVTYENRVSLLQGQRYDYRRGNVWRERRLYV